MGGCFYRLRPGTDQTARGILEETVERTDYPFRKKQPARRVCFVGEASFPLRDDEVFVFDVCPWFGS